ncbi:hypothetical protein U0070_000707 [Myodes glareolus]|uniref:Uncharacterized protein n=1 Tax=Myodes glareolus TaxID=447135 RepID=A0AAW0J6F3_MYOGA
MERSHVREACAWILSRHPRLSLQIQPCSQSLPYAGLLISTRSEASVSSDMAEQYFQESMAHVKDSEGAGRAKFLLIQDDFCNFLQITGQKEVSAPAVAQPAQPRMMASYCLYPCVPTSHQQSPTRARAVDLGTEEHGALPNHPKCGYGLLHQQQALAGMIMWIPSDSVYLVYAITTLSAGEGLGARM